MVKHNTILGLLLSLMIVIALVSCKSPDANPVQPPPAFRDGIALDHNANNIAPDVSGQPYLIESDWEIGSGRTVTIAPGTVFLLKDSVSIVVDGQLQAIGNSSDPIIFTSARTDPEMGDWRGVKLNNAALDQRSEFRYCIFTYGALFPTDTTSEDAKFYKGMLVCRNSSPIIEHCVITKNQNNAIYLTGESCQPIIRYNIFFANDASAVRADTTALITTPETWGQPGYPDISYNCVGENSSPAFIYGKDSLYYGKKYQLNANLDTVDAFFNIDDDPLFMSDGDEFQLSSCSPAIDAGPRDADLENDGTRADLGVHPYEQQGAGDLRGIIGGTLSADVPYRMSCDVKVDRGTTLTIPAGTMINVDSPSDRLYYINVFGRLVIEGTPDNRVTINALNPAQMWGGIRIYSDDSTSAPSVFYYADLINYRFFQMTKPGTEFVGCRFDSAFEYGVSIATASMNWDSAVRIQDCTFERCGTWGIGVFSSAATIRNTLVQNGRGRGITLDATDVYVQITNCVMRNNSTTGLYMADVCSPQVVNCVSMNNGYYGIEMDNNCLPVIMNNIIYNNARYGIYARNSSAPIMTYNDVFGNTPDYVLPPLVEPSNSISENPQFVSETDLHLAAGSPCIDAGNPAADYNDGNGTRNDMGVYGGPNGQSGFGVLQARPTASPFASK